jgi:hypothetical protein
VQRLLDVLISWGQSPIHEVRIREFGDCPPVLLWDLAVAVEAREEVRKSQVTVGNYPATEEPEPS